jgi:hypothetical protein
LNLTRSKGTPRDGRRVRPAFSPPELIATLAARAAMAEGGVYAAAVEPLGRRHLLSTLLPEDETG